VKRGLKKVKILNFHFQKKVVMKIGRGELMFIVHKKESQNLTFFNFYIFLKLSLFPFFLDFLIFFIKNPQCLSKTRCIQIFL